MEAHRLLMNEVYKKTGIKIGHRDYCYCAIRNTIAIELYIDEGDFEELYGIKKVVTDTYIFNRTIPNKKDRDREDLVVFNYTINPHLKLDSKIDVGGKMFGVIAPDGKFYKCQQEGHHYLSDTLNAAHVFKETNHKDLYEWNSFIKLTYSYLMEIEFVFSFETTKYDYKLGKVKKLRRHTITKEQIATITSYIKGLGRSVVNFNFIWYHIDDLIHLLEVEGNEYLISQKYGERSLGSKELDRAELEIGN